MTLWRSSPSVKRARAACRKAFLCASFASALSLSGCVTPLREGYFPPPQYPEEAAKHGWHGEVFLSVDVGPDGFPSSIKVARSSGYPVLDEAAVAGVKNWRWPTGADKHYDFPIGFKIH